MNGFTSVCSWKEKRADVPANGSAHAQRTASPVGMQKIAAVCYRQRASALHAFTESGKWRKPANGFTA
ncbi:MAG: hypothetical protein LKI80_02415 [Sporolactobacillus sp.]|nr:hypothetical protein [Sporolactobacillus sp.]